MSILQAAGLSEDAETQLAAALLLNFSESEPKIEKITWSFDPTFWDRYKILPKAIGSGGFGDVYVGTDKSSKRKVAIKLIHRVSTALDHEIILSKALLGPDKTCLSQFACYIEHAIVNDPKKQIRKYAIVYEYVAGTDLTDLLEIDENKNYQPFDIKRVKKLLCSALKGLKELHSRNIAHRDIKLENLRVVKDDEIVYLDFGFSCFTNKEPKCIVDMSGTPCITMSYDAAKNFNSPKTTSFALAEDVYALALAFYPLVVGKDPPSCILEDTKGGFQTHAEIRGFIIEAYDNNMFAKESDILKHIGSEEKKFAQVFLSMMAPYAVDRPTAQVAWKQLCD